MMFIAYIFLEIKPFSHGITRSMFLLDSYPLLGYIFADACIHYPFQAVVSEENDMEWIAHCFLSAAVRVNANPNQFSLRDVVEKFKTLSQLDRKPSKCVVFEDDPSDITAAHNCTMMAVGLISVH